MQLSKLITNKSHYAYTWKLIETNINNDWCVVCRENPASIKDIAKILNISYRTATVYVSSMINKGIFEIKRDVISRKVNKKIYIKEVL
jgi:predicted transcriptional regulator